jgi:hypothetical protein
MRLIDAYHLASCLCIAWAGWHMFDGEPQSAVCILCLGVLIACFNLIWIIPIDREWRSRAGSRLPTNRRP